MFDSAWIFASGLACSLICFPWKRLASGTLALFISSSTRFPGSHFKRSSQVSNITSLGLNCFSSLVGKSATFSAVAFGFSVSETAGVSVVVELASVVVELASVLVGLASGATASATGFSVSAAGKAASAV